MLEFERSKQIEVVKVRLEAEQRAAEAAKDNRIAQQALEAARQRKAREYLKPKEFVKKTPGSLRLICNICKRKPPVPPDRKKREHGNRLPRNINIS